MDISPVPRSRDATSPRRYDCDVAVIGAGMAGLSAARSLLAAGRSVQVLEARDRVGGRIHTDRDSFPIPLDLGAFWLHQDPANPNPLVEVAKQLGFETRADAATELATDGVHDPEHEGERFTRERDAIHETWVSAGQSGVDVPIAQLAPQPSKWSRVACDSMLSLDVGVEAENASSRDYAVMADEETDRVLPGGMGQFVDAFAKDVPIRTGAAVQHVKWGRDGVTVTTADGRTTRARKLVVTVSTGVLASGAITFDPPLPAWKQQAFKDIPMGHFNKVVMEFDPGALPKTEPGAFLHVMHPSGKPVEFVLEPFGTDLAVGFLGGQFAEKMEKAGDGPAIDYAVSQLAGAVGRADLKSHLKKAVVTHWGSDPYSRGSYSAAAPGHQADRQLLAQPVDDILFFAGEAFEDRYAATVAGAYRSGSSTGQAVDRAL